MLQIIFFAWASFKKCLFFMLTLGIVHLQVAQWDNGKNVDEEVIELQLPATETVLKVFAKRSNPVQPEFDRRLEIHTSGKPVQKVDLTGDTSGANVIDVFVKREQASLRVFLTSPFYYAMEQRLEPGSAGPYPDVSDDPSSATLKRFEQFIKDNPATKLDAVQMAREFPPQKFWILFDGKIPLSIGSTDSASVNLTRLGHFDTRFAKWLPAGAPSPSGQR